MSTGLSRSTSSAFVVSDIAASRGGIRAWIHPDVVSGTTGWSKDATNSGLYDETKNRRFLTSTSKSGDADTGVDVSYREADPNVSGSVGWGQPVLSATSKLLVVFRTGSL